MLIIRQKRGRSESAIGAFCRILKNSNWLLDESMGCQEMFEKFSTFLYLFDISFHKAVFRIKNNPLSKWIMDKVRASQEEFKEMYWEARDSDDPVLKENYKKAKAQHSKTGG